MPGGSGSDARKTSASHAGWHDPIDGVQYPYNVLIAQEQNLGWDARLRHHYAALVGAAALAWSGRGLVAGVVIANGTIEGTLLSFASPISSGSRRRLDKSVQREPATRR